MKSLQLKSGASMPCIALGSWVGTHPKERAKASSWLLTALEAGYRHIDTAALYGTEGAVGEAVKLSGIPRKDLFITTKLPWHHTRRVRESLDESLKRAGLDYFDLYLIHWPQVVVYENDHPAPLNADGSLMLDETCDFNDTWKEMEKVLASGKVRSIGVSNFSIKTLEQLLKTAKVMPAVLQIELHPYLAQNELLQWCKENGIAVVAYAATGYAVVREDPTVVALAKKYNVTPTQIVLSWHIRRGTGLVTKSENASRQEENLKVIKLHEGDARRIDALDKNRRLCIKPDKQGKVFGWTFDRLGWQEERTPQAEAKL
ncbi:NADP-dependent oxidoreductase domain-containing protein [Suillus paluster]|uniref:NADP-dependent oxidoreductase domain-containing protein n=1 Tax=Suillus paluster TaxID=48578 RepID=UPI001B85C044|nr:NADP-dependent oxidoreductase domain-containing protein [Suillus paluster]KAG1744634.1 NADP-dependent oxidoreductase domain-containing protein [Suillus paluster]